MTPDIHTKTYAERSGLGGIGGGGLSGLGQQAPGGSSLGGQGGPGHHYASIHGSAKTSKNQHLMGLAIGGHSALNTNSMITGIGNVSTNGGQPGTHSNMGMYSGGNNVGETDQEIQKINRTNPVGSPNDFDNLGEDLIMMNIPREGNAEQLNKSTKLTLSSKKQYDNHL